MKIKLKLSELYAGYVALKGLAGYKFPPSIAWRIKKNIQALEPDFKEFEKTCYELAKEKKYGEDLGNGRFKIAPEFMDKFKEETKALEDEISEVDISQLALENIHEISTIDLIALEWMFIPPSEPASPKNPTAGPANKRRK